MDQSLINIDERIRTVLEKHPAIELAVLFGSLAKGTATFRSDLDLAVSATHPLDVNEKIKLIEDLAESTGRPVDLVDLRTAGEPLSGQILSNGRRILGSKTLFASFLTRHLIEQADFMPYRQRILEERRQVWIGA
ncbi:MAG: nucleotidyltransferase domain-containing protein [Chlorobiaceae bacterium]